MNKILILLSLIVVAAGCVACGTTGAPSADSPTEAYKRLYAAVKAKDIEMIKKELTAKTIDLGKLSMERFKKTEQQAYENGFTATTFSEALPPIRDERIKDGYGAVEVWNAKDNRWDDVPFMLEHGRWKLAVGDAFSGSFKSPGKGRDMLEKEAANALRGNSGPVPASNVNPVANSNSK